MKPWLSVCVPSINSNNLHNLIDSLYENRGSDESWLGIEIVINNDKWNDKVTICTQFEDMISRASADWLFFPMDDVTCETPNWDIQFKLFTQKHSDGVALFWPNDMVFGMLLSCFPLISKKVAQAIMPLPYKHYKIDDTIMDVHPPDRRFYAQEIIFRHNCKFSRNPTDGCLLEDGRVYPIDRVAAEHDNELWIKEYQHRIVTRIKLLEMML